MKEREDDFWRLKGKQKYKLRAKTRMLTIQSSVAKTKRENSRVVSERNTLILARLNANLTCSTVHPTNTVHLFHRQLIVSYLFAVHVRA